MIATARERRIRDSGCDIHSHTQSKGAWCTLDLQDMSETETHWLSADSILFATAHRPWPLPQGPWVMTQMWKDLLFLHYPVAPDRLRPLVPDVLTLDTYGYRAWVSITPFHLAHLRPPGVPALPWVSSFPELNVRTYVTYGGKSGVYFFSLDAANLSAVWGARMFYRLPYWHAAMMALGLETEEIRYHSKRIHGPKPAEFRATFGPAGSARRAVPGSLEEFLAERYCLYAYSGKRLYRTQIHHLPWALQPAYAEVEQNTMTRAAHLPVEDSPEIVQFSRKLRVLVWAPERLQ